jgi:hypothetical protein
MVTCYLSTSASSTSDFKNSLQSESVPRLRWINTLWAGRVGRDLTRVQKVVGSMLGPDTLSYDFFKILEPSYRSYGYRLS